MLTGILTNVVTRYISSNLSQQAITGDLELYVDDTTVFGSVGTLKIGEEILSYRTFDDDPDAASYLELETALVADYPIDDDEAISVQVYPYPLMLIKKGTVNIGDSTVTYPIDTRLWALVADGVRDDSLNPVETSTKAETVIIENNVIVAIKNTAPAIDGQYTIDGTLTLIKLAGDVTDYINTAAAGGVDVVETLPTLPDAAYPAGKIVAVSSEDYMLYRSLETEWTAAISTIHLTGTIQSNQIEANAIISELIAADAIIAGKIAAGAVDTAQLVAGAVKAGIIAANTITAGDGVIANAAIASAQIISLTATKITTGILNADVVSIKGQSNNLTIDQNGIRIYKVGNPLIGVEIDANEPDGKILKIKKGALSLEDGDENIIIDKDGMVADGIIRGIMPGSNNPIVNSSFEKVTPETIIPTNWTRSGTNSAGINTDNTKFKYGTKAFHCNNATTTDAKASQTVLVKAGLNYVSSFYYKSENLGIVAQWGNNVEWGDGTEWGAGADVGEQGAFIEVRDSTGVTVLAVSPMLLGTSLGEWTRVVLPVFNTGTDEEVIVNIVIGTAENQIIGNLWLDAIMLSEGAVVQPWSQSIYDFLDHTNDKDVDVYSLHHTLGTTQYQAAPGNILETIHPVGSIYLNASDDTNPGTLFGFGTWSAFGAGKFLVGLDSGDMDFDTAEKTGGAKTHTLATPEMPSHTHTLSLGGGQVIWDYVTQFQAGANRNGITGGSLNGIQPTGGGGAHNNLSPYIVVYMWKRTA